MASSAAWRVAGSAAALATVARARGSSSRATAAKRIEGSRAARASAER